MYIDIKSVKVPEAKTETIVGNENIYDSLLDLSNNIVGLESLTLDNVELEAYMVANEQKIDFIKIVEKDVEVANEGIIDLIVKGIKKIFEFILKSIKFLITTIGKLFKSLLSMLKKLFKKPTSSGGGSGSTSTPNNPNDIKNKTENEIDEIKKKNKEKNKQIKVLNDKLNQVWVNINKHRGDMLYSLSSFKYAFINDKTINGGDLVFTTNYLNMIDEFLNELYLKNIVSVMDHKNSTNIYSNLSKQIEPFIDFFNDVKEALTVIIKLDKIDLTTVRSSFDDVLIAVNTFYTKYITLVENRAKDISTDIPGRVNMKKLNQRLENSDIVKNYVPESSDKVFDVEYVGIVDVTFNKFLYYIFTLDKVKQIDRLEKVVKDSIHIDTLEYRVGRDGYSLVTPKAVFFSKSLLNQKAAFVSFVNSLMGSIAKVTSLSRLSHHVYKTNDPVVDGIYVDKLKNILKVDERLKIQKDANGFLTFDFLQLSKNITTMDDFMEFTITMHDKMVEIYDSINKGKNKIHKSLIDYVDSLDKNKDVNNNLLKVRDSISDIDKLISSLYNGSKPKKDDIVVKNLNGIYDFYKVLNTSIVTGIKSITDISDIQNDINNIEKLLASLSGIATSIIRYNVILTEIKKIKGE